VDVKFLETSVYLHAPAALSHRKESLGIDFIEKWLSNYA
jgi:hypothetical protein